jgi:hypothetical protein
MPDSFEHRCPFYGFHWPARGSRLFRGKAGECGLELVERGPCRMEMRENRVDFEHCQVREDLASLLDAGKRHIRFHAPEFPEEGLDFEVWKDRVLRGK